MFPFVWWRIPNFCPSVSRVPITSVPLVVCFSNRLSEISNEGSWIIHWFPKYNSKRYLLTKLGSYIKFFGEVAIDVIPYNATIIIVWFHNWMRRNNQVRNKKLSGWINKWMEESVDGKIDGLSDCMDNWVNE